MVANANPQKNQDGISLLDRARNRAFGRVLDLEALADGWLDGEGLRPQEGALRSLRECIEDHPRIFLNSGIFPTFEGGVLIEETIGSDEAEVLITPEGVFEPSWNGEDLRDIPELEKRRLRTLSLAVPALEHLLAYDGASIIVRAKTGLGPIHGFALPDGEAAEFIGIIAGQTIWKAFLLGECCLRDVHLDVMTRIFLFNQTGCLVPVEDIVPEAWLPDPGLMVRDLPLERPFA